MKVHKFASRTLRYISYFWMAYPAIFILYALLAVGSNGAEIMRTLLGPLYWIASILSVVTGVGLIQIRRYGWYLFLFSNFINLYLCALIIANGHDFNFILFALTGLAQVILIFLVKHDIRVPYFFPRIRWWESDPRYKLSVQTKISGSDQNIFDGEIMDISLGGCFVKTHGYFKTGEKVHLNFTLFEKNLSCSGNIVWRADSTVTHPKGVGVKFHALDKETLLVLREVRGTFNRLIRTYNQLSRERNWQEYVQREQQYQGKHLDKK